MIELSLNPSQQELRTFAIGGVPFSLLVGGLGWWNTGSFGLLIVLLAISLLVAVIGWLRPQSLRWIYVAWMVLLFPVAWLMSHLVLAVVYFGILTPIACVRRLLGHREFPLRGDDSPTYWTPAPRSQSSGSRAFRQF